MAPEIGPQVVNKSVSWRSSRRDGGENKMEDNGRACGDAGVEGGLGSTAYFKRTRRLWNEVKPMFVKPLQIADLIIEAEVILRYLQNKG